MPNILDLSARLSADVRPFVNSMASGANASHTTFQNIAQAATMYLGARGLLGTLNRANQASMEFGQSLADASAISTLSVKEIGDAIMSLDNVFGRVTKASQSMYRILSSGFSQLDANQLVEFQKAVGVSAKVIRADLYNTADVMTTIANAYQLNIKEIEKLQDWFYITVREGKAQGQDLARTLGLVINSASEAGVSLNELGAAIAVLSRTQSVSQSMIGLNQMLNAFIKPTLQAQAAARKWGIEISATALQEKGLTAILTELNQKVGGNVEALEKMFGNIRAGRAILSLTGKQFQNYLNVLNEYDIGAGAGMEAFEKQIDTVQNAYERLQAQHEKTMIQIGDDWSGFRKIMYRTGEALSKAFSDSTAFSRWVIYINGINLAVKNIIAVVKNLRTSVDRVTASTERMASAFGKASIASSGLYHGARPDTIALRRKIDSAIRTVTGDFTPLQATYDTIMRQATPWYNLNNARGINPKNNPYSFIAQNELSMGVSEHRAKARAIARRAMGNYFVKTKDIIDPTTGQVVDWQVKNAATGFAYKRTWNQLENNMTKSVMMQNERAMNRIRTTIASAIQTLSGAKGTEAQILQAADARVNAFFGADRGHRYGTVSKMTSWQRLMRMKNISPLSLQGQFGLGMSNFGKGWNTFTSTLGESMGKVFTATATAGMTIAVTDWGYRFGKNISEALELSETTLFRRVGGWLAKFFDENWIPTAYPDVIQHGDYRDAERTSLQSQLFVTQGRYQQSIKRARMVGLSENEIAQYQLNFMKILNDNDNLESATEQLRELVNNFTKQLDEMNSKIERANKFERERIQLLDSYGKRSLANTITTKQKAAITSIITDFSKFDKDPDILRIAKDIIANPDSVKQLTQTEYAKAFTKEGGFTPALAEATDTLIRSKLFEGIFNGGVGIDALRSMYNSALYYIPGAGMQRAEGILGWLKDGKLLKERPQDGGLPLRTSLLQDALGLIDKNPANLEDAKEDAMTNLVRPLISSRLMGVLDTVNDLVAEITDDLMSVDELPLDVENSEKLYAEKAKKARKTADTIKKKYEVALGHAMQERELVRDSVRTYVAEAIPDMPLEEVDKEVEAQMAVYDKTFIANMSDARDKALRAEQNAMNLENKANDVRVSKIGDTLTNIINRIEMQSLRKRINTSQEAMRRINAYKHAADAYNRELDKIGKKDSESYQKVRKLRDEALKNMYKEQGGLALRRSQARLQLLDAVTGVASNNMQGDRLSNYGLYHATNLLARLAPGLNIQQQGVSLSQVLANANARYSGSTPDTSRAMQQQQRLSTIMDSYIASKQYQDASIGKNVETIVTIMGKRTPLFLN